MNATLVNFNSKEGMKMKKSVFFLSCVVIFFLVPALSSAECTNIGGFDNFRLEGNNTVILYSGSLLVVRFDVQNCSIQPTSKIRLIKSDVCDGDEIMIDSEKCVMMEIKPLGP
jgi:hypothetical protein